MPRHTGMNGPGTAKSSVWYQSVFPTLPHSPPVEAPCNMDPHSYLYGSSPYRGPQTYLQPSPNALPQPLPPGQTTTTTTTISPAGVTIQHLFKYAFSFISHPPPWAKISPEVPSLQGSTTAIKMRCSLLT